MSAVDLPIGKLRRRPDARQLRADTVAGLAESIREVGIINPLRVRPISIFEGGRETEGWEITAGRHRFEAATAAGLSTVPCIIVEESDLLAELAMIDENLMRAELSPADRARETSRRKEIYEQIHPETRHGHGPKESRKVCDSSTERFTKDTSGKVGRSERLVQLDAERGEKISERALALVAGTHLDRGNFLDKIKKLGPQEQEARIARELAAGPAPRKPISPAPEPRNPFESYQVWLTKLVKIFEAAPEEWREDARDHLYPDVPVMDRGAA